MSGRRLTWIFDLDNTLHDARVHVFPYINRAMTAYLARHLDVAPERANELRLAYWRNHGATLVGMMRHHGTDPAHFLRHTHDFPDLAAMLVAERRLVDALRRLPGRRIVFSNAPAVYAEAAVRLLGLAPYLDAVYAVDHVGYRPKPSVEGFRAVLARERADPRRCVMVEDTVINLRPAKRLGMSTVWVTNETRRPAFVDFRLDSVAALPRIARRVESAGRYDGPRS